MTQNNCNPPDNIGDRREFQTLVDIIAKLRAPNGCPWDREQTHKSIRENLLSETYEALHALDEGDAKKLCEELGDLLLQIVLHAEIARDTGEFDMGDIVAGINNKLIYRHPHIFGDAHVNSAKEVSVNWEKLKEKEREAGKSMLESVPKEMPALAYAMDIQKRVARVGFDWKELQGVIDKLNEEVKELQEAPNQEERGKEFGDLLFTLVNVGRRMGIDSETELRRANQKFYDRFSHMEKVCRERGCKIGDLPFEEQNKLWNEAKIATGKMANSGGQT